ncbi:hypothetical protein Pfo_031642 [Paulownia fortunei]|nr:hypothetical protein Pfo_031642 [Paulownia fortunei]
MPTVTRRCSRPASPGPPSTSARRTTRSARRTPTSRRRPRSRRSGLRGTPAADRQLAAHDLHGPSPRTAPRRPLRRPHPGAGQRARRLQGRLRRVARGRCGDPEPGAERRSCGTARRGHEAPAHRARRHRGRVRRRAGEGLDSDSASLFASDGDGLRSTIGKAYKDKKAESLPDTAKIEYSSEVPTTAPWRSPRTARVRSCRPRSTRSRR